MKPADETIDCPRCGHPCPAWIISRAYARDQLAYRVWCEAHGAKQVTI